MAVGRTLSIVASERVCFAGHHRGEAWWRIEESDSLPGGNPMGSQRGRIDSHPRRRGLRTATTGGGEGGRKTGTREKIKNI